MLLLCIFITAAAVALAARRLTAPPLLPGPVEVARLPGALSETQDPVAARTSQRDGAEAHLWALNAELEQRVAECTAELEAAVEELAAFSYAVSHDLRTPLRAVNGYSRIVLEEYGPQVPPEVRQYLNLVCTSALHMGNLIDGLLAFSRLSRQPLNKEPVNPGALVRQVLGDLQGEGKDRTIALSVDELPPCRADPDLLRQVLQNLLSNAFKFTRKCEVAVIEVGSLEKEGEHVYFVKDSGVGFDMRYADKLFGVFQRLHRAEDYEGTGVGLAVVERIVHRHGGRVWAEALPDQGAAFYFTLGGRDP